MIHIFHGAKPGTNDLVDGMFEDRKRLFVDLLGWDVQVIGERFEVDAFDTADAIYLIAEAEGRHVGSLRLLPSDGPHLLGALFPQLCPFGVPTAPDIFEITRLCLPQRLGAGGRLTVRNALITAMVRHALDTGIARLTGVVEAGFRKEILAMGWRAEPLGPSRPIRSATLGAFAIDLAGDTPARLRWTGIWREDVAQPIKELAA